MAMPSVVSTSETEEVGLESVDISVIVPVLDEAKTVSELADRVSAIPR